jgi:hypothetical protein
MRQDIELIANHAAKGLMTLDGAKAWFGEVNRAKNAVRRLERDGLVFRIARGEYAVPERRHLADALAIRHPLRRQAVWLQAWLRRKALRRRLPEGLDWEGSVFFSLAVDAYTDLRWHGPVLLVPIAKGSERVGRVHHTVPVFLYDAAGEPETIDVNRHSIAVPSRMETARILAVHSNPRLREAAASVPDSERKTFRLLVSRTSPPTPFPDPKSRLKRGPPFRYRLYAPMSWVLEDNRFGRAVDAEDAGASA